MKEAEGLSTPRRLMGKDAWVGAPLQINKGDWSISRVARQRQVVKILKSVWGVTRAAKKSLEDVVYNLQEFRGKWQR